MGGGMIGLTADTPKRPILRYHGGKWMLAEWIISHFPAHRVYTETYGGAASVLMQKPRSYGEVYNDLDGEIVNLFRVIREEPRKLYRLIAQTPFARDEYRASFRMSVDPIEQARRTVIRSFMGFGSNALNREIKSGFRANANRSGTTPAHDWKNLPPNIKAVARRLRGVVIENLPAMTVIEKHDGPDTLHYLDPPYVHTTRSYLMNGGPRTHGYAHEMTDDNHRELARFIRGIKGMVVLSGYHSPLYDELYEGWRVFEKAALADGAARRVEVLWLNDSAASRLHQGVLWGAA